MTRKPSSSAAGKRAASAAGAPPRSSTASGPAASAGRTRAARSDALITKMQGTIEAAFGLPAGSVKLVGPPRRGKLLETSTVGDLRALWQPKS